MTDSNLERFALYFTFATKNPLYQKATQWLGHCVYNQDIDSSQSLISVSDKFRMVRKAAHYGFHATLKPPFRLRSGTTQADLEAHLQSFTSEMKAITCPPLKIHSIANFIALIPSDSCAELNHLAKQCVIEFEQFRAPLNEIEMQKRLSSPLTVRQQQLLDEYGYPYVLDEFRFHMTLSDRMQDGLIDDALQQLSFEFSPLLNSQLNVDCVCLCHQSNPDDPFTLIKSYPLQK